MISYNPILAKQPFEQFKKLISHVKNEKRTPEEVYTSLGGILPKKKKDVSKSDSQPKVTF